MSLITLFFAFISYSSITAQVLTKVEPIQVGMSAERLDYLTNTLQEYVDNGELSGAVALIAGRGQVGPAKILFLYPGSRLLQIGHFIYGL